jgi:hypothetical protein
MTAAKVLAARLESEGVNVSIIQPPWDKDWLDRLNALRAVRSGAESAGRRSVVERAARSGP